MAGGVLLGTVELQPADAPLQLPERFLPAFAGGGVLSAWLDGCLALWPLAAWSALVDRIMTLPLSVADARSFNRLLFASAVEFDFNRGTVTVPAEQRAMAGLGERVLLVGAGDHAELWDPARWATQAGRRLEDLDLPAAV